MTTREWWQARLIETKALGQQFDVTKTWTEHQRIEDTRCIAGELATHLAGKTRLVDFGCGKGRFLKAFPLEYLGVDILLELKQYVEAAGGEFFLYDNGHIPERIDGDVALFCLVIQHLDDHEAYRALTTTNARRLIIVEGAWKSDGYTKARTVVALQDLVGSAGAERSIAFEIKAPEAKYKVVVGDRPAVE